MHLHTLRQTKAEMILQCRSPFIAELVVDVLYIIAFIISLPSMYMTQMALMKQAF